MFPQISPKPLFLVLFPPFSSFSSARFLHQKLKKTINMLLHFVKLHNTQNLSNRHLVRRGGIWTRWTIFSENFPQVRLRENVLRIFLCDNLCCVSKRFFAVFLYDFRCFVLQHQKNETKMLGPLCQTWKA